MIGSSPSRRRFLLGTASLAASVGLAGCQGRRPASLEPHLPERRLREAGWRQVEDLEERVSEEVAVAGSTRTIRVHGKADVYENARLVEQLAETLGTEPGESTIPAETFVAAKARVDPPVSRVFALSDTILERVMDLAEDRAKRQLRRNGFSNVRRVADGDLDIEAGDTATHRRYRADYAYEAFDVSYRGTPVTIEPGAFTIEAQLAVWPYRGLLATGAGVYPGEEGRLTVAARGTTRELSMGFEPERYRSDVRGLIAVVS